MSRLFWLAVLLPQVAVAAGEATVPLQKLSELSPEQLSKIDVITPSLRHEPAIQAPATVYVITEDDLLRYGLRDLKDVIRFIPGAEWSFDQNALQGGLRGFPSNWSQILLMVNGREVQNLLGGAAYISFQFETHAVKQVEISMGPASALYGAKAVLGVINIITKKDDESLQNGGYARESVGSWGTFSTGGMYRRTFGEDGVVYASANFFLTDNEDLGDYLSRHTDLWKSRAVPFTAPDSNPKYPYRNQARSTLIEAELRDHGFYLGTLHLRNYSEGGIEQARALFGERTLRREELLVYVGFDRALTDRLRLKLEYLDFTEDDIDLFTFRDIVTQPIDPSTVRDPGVDGAPEGFFGVDGAKKRRADAQVDLKLHETNVLIGGATFEAYDLKTGPLYGSDLNLLPTGDTDLAQVKDTRRLRFDKLGLFLQDQQALWTRLFLTAGLRLDHISTFGWVFDPRAGVVVKPWTNGSVKLLYARAFREPSIFELSSPGSANLRPTRSTSYELGLTQALGDFLMMGTVFTNRMTDAIVPNPFAHRETGAATFINAPAGTVHSDGAELSATWRHGRWQPFAKYAYITREHFSDPVTGIEADNVDVAPHKLVAGGSVSVLEGKAFLSAYNVFNSRVTSVVATLDGKGTEVIAVPPYDNVTLAAGLVGVRLGELALDATLVFDNLLDRDNLKPNLRGNDPRMYPQNHFNARLMVRIHL